MAHRVMLVGLAVEYLNKEKIMFTLEYAKNPIFNSEDGQQINLIVKWNEFVEEMPFNATSFDPEPWGVDLWNRALAGEFGEISPFVKPIRPTIDFQPTPTNTI